MVTFSLQGGQEAALLGVVSVGGLTGGESDSDSRHCGQRAQWSVSK